MTPSPLSRSLPAGSEVRKLIGFEVGAVRYGIDIMRIREIVNPAPLVALPSAPSHVLGVVDHRNMVIPVISLRRRFALADAPADRRTKWILIRSGDRELGLEVDRVTQVIRVTEADRRDRRSMMQKVEEPWVREVFSDAGGLVFEVDVESVVHREAALFAPEERRIDRRDDEHRKA